MPKTRRTKRNVNPPITENRFQFLANATETMKNGKLRRVVIITGAPRGKAYPYASARQGYPAAPRVVQKNPALTVLDDGTLTSGA